MSVENVISKNPVIKNSLIGHYNHYIALDWSMTVMAIARLREGWSSIKHLDFPAINFNILSFWNFRYNSGDNSYLE